MSPERFNAVSIVVQERHLKLVRSLISERHIENRIGSIVSYATEFSNIIYFTKTIRRTELVEFACLERIEQFCITQHFFGRR